MNCMEARRMVTPFIEKKLSDKEMEKFLKHLDGCKDCMEELDIYYMIYKAMDTLDSKKSYSEYNLQKKLMEEIHQAKMRILRHKVLRFTLLMALIAAAMILLINVLAGFHIKRLC